MSAGTSVEIDRAREALVARRLEVDALGAACGEQLDLAALAAGQAFVLLDAEQPVRWPAPVGDEDRPGQRRLFLACPLSGTLRAQ